MQINNEYLLNEIRSQFKRKDFMQFLFSLIAGFPIKRKLLFYEAFLSKNKEFDDFENLPYEPTISDWTGSAVPML